MHSHQEAESDILCYDNFNACLHVESLNVHTNRKVNANANARLAQTQTRDTTLQQYRIDSLTQRKCMKGAPALVIRRHMVIDVK